MTGLILRLEIQGKFLGVRPEVEGEPCKGLVALDPRAGDERCLSGVGLGDDDVRVSCLDGRHYGREDAADRPKLSVQAEFGDEDRAPCGPDVVRRAQRRHGNGQIESGAALGQGRGNEVGRDLAPAQRNAGVLGSRTDPLLGFVEGRVGQPQDDEGRQGLANIGLDLHDVAVQPHQGHRVRPAQRHLPHPLEVFKGARTRRRPGRQ